MIAAFSCPFRPSSESFRPVVFGNFPQPFPGVNACFVKAVPPEIHLFFTSSSLFFYFFTQCDKLRQNAAKTVTVLSRRAFGRLISRLFRPKKIHHYAYIADFSRNKKRPRNAAVFGGEMRSGNYRPEGIPLNRVSFFSANSSSLILRILMPKMIPLTRLMIPITPQVT